MFEASEARLGNAGLATLIRTLANPEPCADDSARVDRIRLLEELQAAAAAEQARVTAEFASSQRAVQRAAGVPNDRVGRGIAAQVALAKRASPHAAQRYVGWSTIL